MSTVSVIIAVHNGADTIARAIKSALAQDETLEVLVVDDASTDHTSGIAGQAAAGDDRLKIIRLAVNRGPSAARNAALHAASGELLCVLDADDWMQPGRLARMLRVAGDGWDMVADDLLIADAVTSEALYPMVGLQAPARVIQFKEFVSANLPHHTGKRQELGYLKPLIRRAFLERFDLRYDISLRLGEDFILYATALAHGATFALTPACGYIAVQRSGSLSRAHAASDLRALAQADEALLALVKRDPAAFQVVKRHQRHTLNKYYHRVALDAKRRGDWLEVARSFTGTWSAALHISWETLQTHFEFLQTPSALRGKRPSQASGTFSRPW